jgi:hypothetical protein
MAGRSRLARTARIVLVAAALTPLAAVTVPSPLSAGLPTRTGGSSDAPSTSDASSAIPPPSQTPSATPASAASPAAPATPGVIPDTLSAWTGGIDLYRTGVFTTQKTWRWCTAADVQIIRNIVRHRTDHSFANQQTYYTYMRAHNRYPIPPRDGVDPKGWTMGLRHFVDDRYRRVSTDTFGASLRSAVTALRKTNLPVGLLVAHGDHAWVLTGFTATADPASTSNFTVTSVRVVGPLWGLQSSTYGYDMRPDKKLTRDQLRTFWTRWHYAGIHMAWEGQFVSIQPVG